MPKVCRYRPNRRVPRRVDPAAVARMYCQARSYGYTEREIVDAMRKKCGDYPGRECRRRLRRVEQAVDILTNEIGLDQERRKLWEGVAWAFGSILLILRAAWVLRLGLNFITRARLRQAEESPLGKPSQNDPLLEWDSLRHVVNVQLRNMKAALYDEIPPTDLAA